MLENTHYFPYKYQVVNTLWLIADYWKNQVEKEIDSVAEMSRE
jgi:hypothetical protein